MKLKYEVTSLYGSVVKCHRNDVGKFYLAGLNGNHGVCVSFGAEIFEAFRGNGRGKKQHLDRLEQIRLNGHDFAICTVRGDNAVEKHILSSNGWRHLAHWSTHDSSDGGSDEVHFVELWGRDMKQADNKDVAAHA